MVVAVKRVRLDGDAVTFGKAQSSYGEICGRYLLWYRLLQYHLAPLSPLLYLLLQWPQFHFQRPLAVPLGYSVSNNTVSPASVSSTALACSVAGMSLVTGFKADYILDIVVRIS